MTDKTPLTHVCSLDDIPIQGARRLLTAHGEIAIFRTVTGEIFALRNQCPHKKGPLSEGIVHGDKVTCPLHNWVINLRTGEAEGADHGCTPTLAVELRGHDVYLALPSSSAAKAVA
jgi:nitrite reductase (NADH) small subunit